MRQTILVAEDDHALHDVLMRGLRDEDFDPVPAPDGATALRLATADISAAVLDIGLPDADGRDVCQAMRANGFPSPVISLTAHHEGTAAGATPGPLRRRRGDVRPRAHSRGTVRGQPAGRVTAPQSKSPACHGVMSRWTSLRETAR